MRLVKVKSHFRKVKDKWIPVQEHKRIVPMSSKQIRKFKKQLTIPQIVHWKLKRNLWLGRKIKTTPKKLQELAIKGDKENEIHRVLFAGKQFKPAEFLEIYPIYGES